jgi:hypothetical protein
MNAGPTTFVLLNGAMASTIAAPSATKELDHASALSRRTLNTLAGIETTGNSPVTSIQMPVAPIKRPACSWTIVRGGRNALESSAKSRAHHVSAASRTCGGNLYALMAMGDSLNKPQARPKPAL